MNDSVDLVESSAGQMAQMAGFIENVANTSSSLFCSEEQISETTSSVMETLTNGVNSSNTSQKTIEAMASKVGDMAK
ncbi:MAG: methyl-accepting chemotaxis protein [Colwellia sp.]|jgi:methyl-accepting chemotaxis protein